MVTIEIDGKPLSVEPGVMIIEAADEAGIHIPRFCYHKKLSIAANCRMCLVQVENARKPMPACATPVTEGMKVFTHSEMAKTSQQAVMEFLLVNHPLDCPICDQGGQCELQDVAMDVGSPHSHYDEPKRAVTEEALGPLVATEMTRCIHCTRCVRFGDEIAGLREMGGTFRGENVKIGTYVEQVLQSELSGNIIDLCPVGALTSKPFRFKARAWELQQHSGIAPHDALGSHVYVHTRGTEVMRVVPKTEESLNENWLSDRDRFSYLALDSEDRVTTPMVKDNGVWQEVSWTEALNTITSEWKAILQASGPDALAGLISPNATLEECYLFQKLLRELGVRQIDHRLRLAPGVSGAADLHESLPALSLERVAEVDLIFIIGSHLAHEQPILAHRVRKNSDAEILNLAPMDWSLHADVAHSWIVTPAAMADALAQIVKAVAEQRALSVPVAWQNTLASVTVSAQARIFAERLLASRTSVILAGAVATQDPAADTMAAMIRWLTSHLSAAQCAFLPEGCNAVGAWLAGCVPHRLPNGQAPVTRGQPAMQWWSDPIKAYFLWNIEPSCDLSAPVLADEAYARASFVVACTPFADAALRDRAHVLLPLAPWSETEGTYVNLEHRWQSFVPSVPARAEAKIGWKILRVLAVELGLSGFDFSDAAAIRDELQTQVVAAEKHTSSAAETDVVLPLVLPLVPQGIQRIAEWPLYRVDAMARRAGALQSWDQAVLGPKLRCCAALASRLNLRDGQRVRVQLAEAVAHLDLKIDEAVPDGAVFIPAGYAETAVLGSLAGVVELMGV